MAFIGGQGAVILDTQSQTGTWTKGFTSGTDPTYGTVTLATDDLVPSVDNTYVLGTQSNRWKEIDATAINVLSSSGGNKTLALTSANTTDGQISTTGVLGMSCANWIYLNSPGGLYFDSGTANNLGLMVRTNPSNNRIQVNCNATQGIVQTLGLDLLINADSAYHTIIGQANKLCFLNGINILPPQTYEVYCNANYPVTGTIEFRPINDGYGALGYTSTLQQTFMNYTNGILSNITAYPVVINISMAIRWATALTRREVYAFITATPNKALIDEFWEIGDVNPRNLSWTGVLPVGQSIKVTVYSSGTESLAGDATGNVATRQTITELH